VVSFINKVGFWLQIESCPELVLPLNVVSCIAYSPSSTQPASARILTLKSVSSVQFSDLNATEISETISKEGKQIRSNEELDSKCHRE
jgi:hypothetical protein